MTVSDFIAALTALPFDAPVVVVHGGCWVMGRHGVASAGGMTPASPRPGG